MNLTKAIKNFCMTKAIYTKCKDTPLEDSVEGTLKKILVYKMYILKIYKLLGKGPSKRKAGK